MQKFGRPVDVKIYPNATHSFFNDTGRAYQPEAAADSWQRTLAWFKQYLPQKA
jgi:carboxymethylenebutenolidase